MPDCTFAELRDILQGLGFRARGGTGAPVVFEHDAVPGRIVVDPLADTDAVDPATLAIVRRNLDERGVLSRAHFDELLAERSLAG